MEEKIRPIDVISVCSAAGEIRPLRLRLEDREQRRLRIDIEEVLSVQEIRYTGVEAHVFLCRGRAEEREMLFELKYTFRSHTWHLLQKLH